MKIIVADRNPFVVEAWTKLGGVGYYGSIFDAECSAVVSPANSFGFMDGGIDYAYLQFFGPRLPADVQDYIKRYHNGELPVGAAFTVDTHHEKIPSIIIAPTMRTPADVSKTVNVYLAVRAALLQMLQLDLTGTVAFPGMGTGCGKVDPYAFARQMKAAVDDVRHERKFPDSLSEAASYERWLIHG